MPLLSSRPAVTSPAAEHHRPLAGTKLHCLVTDHMCVCKQLAQGCNRQRDGRDSNPRPGPVDRRSGPLTTQPPSHYYASGNVFSNLQNLSEPSAGSGRLSESEFQIDGSATRNRPKAQRVQPMRSVLWQYFANTRLT